MTSTHSNNLADFLKKELYEKWKKDRQDIETKWHKNEDAFNGISRDFWKVKETEDWRSDTFVMATKIKVLSAYSVAIEILLQNGVIPFSLALSPWDQIVMEDLPEPEQERIQDSIDDMSGLIRQQILDCKGDLQLMFCVMSASKLGETYWKSFVHDVTRRGFKTVSMAPQGMADTSGKYNRWEYYEQTISSPAYEYVSNWNVFRDLETNDMQKSQGYCERSFVSAYDLRQLIDQPYYINKNIEKAIRDNSQGIANTDKNVKPSDRKVSDKYNNIEHLEFWCRVPRETLELFERDLEGDVQRLSDVDPEDDGDEIEIGAEMAGNEVIRLVRIRPDSRPHGRVEWEINLDDNHGIGVSDNAESMQKALNGMWRAYEDNKKLSANVIIAIIEEFIVNWSSEFTPGETIKIAQEAKSVQNAIQQFVVQDVGESLLSGIGMSERYLDEATQLPKILQGAIHEKQKADTLGELNILMSNAGKYMGSVFKNFDEGLIEPIVWRFYEYNMLDPDVQVGKGNFIATPLGFKGFQDRFVRLGKLLQALQLALSDPEVRRETRIKTLLEEIYGAFEIDPQTIFKTKKEKDADSQAMMQQQQQAVDTQVAMLLAKYKAETEKEIAKIKEKLAADLELQEAKHQDTMEEKEGESDNRIVEKRIGVVK